MDYQEILLERNEGIALVTLNRPERLNAVTPQMTRELLAAFDDIEKDKESRVLVLTGAGRGFCSGADVGGMQTRVGLTAPGEALEDEGLLIRELIPKLHKMQKPTIAMVNGVAVGGGFDLALVCDMRIGSENARFVNGFIRIGLFPATGGTWLYPRVMPLAKALEYLYTGDFVEAKEAERLGILNYLVPAAELEKKTMELAHKIANGPPIAMRLTRLLVYEGLQSDLDTAMVMAAGYQNLTRYSEDHKEGVTAVREKRRPRFKGK